MDRLTMAQFLADRLTRLADELNGSIEDDNEIMRANGGEDEEWPLVRNVRTFEDAGLLTYDAGVVLEMENGTEFQVTIVRSR